MKKINAFLIIFVLINAGFVMAASSSSSDLSSSTAISVSLVNQDPDPAAAGDTMEVRVGVENSGGVSAENLVLEMIPSYPFSLVAGETAKKNVGTLKAYQSDDNIKIIKYNVRVDKDATAGSYELKLKYYQEGSTFEVQKTLLIDISSKESAEIIHIDKTTLVPGEQTKLKFVINNVGNAPLRDLTFYWENEDDIILPVGSDNTKYIKYIDIGESAEVSYEVIADTNADAGLYKLDIHLAYDDTASGEERNIDTIAGVYVGGGTDFDVAFSESSSGSTSFTIANVGSNPASSVSVIIPEQEGWKVTGSNSMIIGNLNTGDYTVASFTLQSAMSRSTGQEDMTPEERMAQRGNTQTSASLKIQIAYTDTMGKREYVDKEVSMNPQSVSTTTTTGTSTETSMNFRRTSQQSFFSKYKWYAVVLVVIAVLGLGYGKYRKEKKKDPDFRLKDIFRKKRKSR